MSRIPESRLLRLIAAGQAMAEFADESAKDMSEDSGDDGDGDYPSTLATDWRQAMAALYVPDTSAGSDGK